MSRVLQSNINTNLHPSFFEFKHSTNNFLPQNRTIESVQRGDPIWSKKEQIFPDQPSLYTERKPKDNYARKALAGIQEVSPFSSLFFSRENINEIQRLIRYNVYVNTDRKFIIDNQDEDELLIIMRGVYLQYSRVPSDKQYYNQAIKKLNALVINVLMPNLISNIEQYVGYLRDSKTPYLPLSREINDSIIGQTELRSVSDVLVGDDLFFGSNQ